MTLPLNAGNRAPISSESEVSELVLRIAELEGENEALRRALATRSNAVESLFDRLMTIESEHAWLVEAVRRNGFLAEAQSQPVSTRRELELQREIEAIMATKTFRVAAPVRRAYAKAREIAARSRAT